MTDATVYEGIEVRIGMGGTQPQRAREKVGKRTVERRRNGLFVRRTGTYLHYLCTYVLFTLCVSDAGSWAKPRGTGDTG